MKFTIVTVCYNAASDIKKTLESVLSQSYTNFQYIIKDGQSTDDTMSIISKVVNNDSRVVIKSCSDVGIYDAMNQALELSIGEYVFFLNAGDVLHDTEVLNKINLFVENNDIDVIYGDIFWVGDERTRKKKYRHSYSKRLVYLLGDCICHQALFSKRELFDEKKYDINYKICADREWQLFYLNKNIKFVPVKTVVADVLVDGFSLQNVGLFEKEVKECLTHYYPRYAWLYKTICRVRGLLKNEGTNY